MELPLRSSARLPWKVGGPPMFHTPSGVPPARSASLPPRVPGSLDSVKTRFAKLLGDGRTRVCAARTIAGKTGRARARDMRGLGRDHRTHYCIAIPAPTRLALHRVQSLPQRAARWLSRSCNPCNVSQAGAGRHGQRSPAVAPAHSVRSGRCRRAGARSRAGSPYASITSGITGAVPLAPSRILRAKMGWGLTIAGL